MLRMTFPICGVLSDCFMVIVFFDPRIRLYNEQTGRYGGGKLAEVPIFRAWKGGIQLYSGPMSHSTIIAQFRGMLLLAWLRG